ncbi:DUF2381 family protein [Myxococcus sp. CA056]|uniref:DUF2381 family protein n=1 Tax=Myxococcus sp. CA056 TaxID=2741740 RepID=UPI00157B4513|nr:DUF2381 family protein [Myxococcus sp. CA056]NTX15467.1 DUF2381 family protein [Myxococcus sp. CA056]
MQVFSPAFLLCLLLAAGGAKAQENMALGVGTRRIDLLPDTVRTAAEVFVSPGLSTVLLFDADVVSDSIEIEGRNLFTRVDVGQATVRLALSPRASPGERLRFSVRFRDGAAPTGASFLLVVHPAKANAVVEVFRSSRTVESYQQEAVEARAEAIRFKEENARLVLEHKVPGGLTGLLAMGDMDVHGVVGMPLNKSLLLDSRSAIKPSQQVRSYRSKNRVAVEVLLEDTRGGQPWSASGATLKEQSGVDLKVLSVWQEAPITSDAAKRVIVEAEAPANASQGTFSLKLWEADGPRTVTISNVTFP